MRKVHPDLNPTMKDATRRSQMVNGMKNNPDGLRRLAITWGYIQPNVFTETRRTAPRYMWTNTMRSGYQRNITPRILSDLGLVPERHYMGGNIIVRIRINKRTSNHKVLRTTKKCVVVDYYGYPKVVRMKNVIRRVGK